MSREPEKGRWRKMKSGESSGPEALLRVREKYCAGACSRFMRRDDKGSHIWTLKVEGAVSALLIHWKRSLFPVFCGMLDTPLPFFLDRFLYRVPIHSIQGLREEELSLERGMIALGFKVNEGLDYDLMALDGEPDAVSLRSGPPGLVLRQPEIKDVDALFELQAAYDREEVIPKGAQFNAAVCRLNLERIIKSERMLVAELDGRPVGKINTSAVSFTRCQIGGVYVHPDYRNLGIARRMTAEFSRDLFRQGWGLSLFVKKRNVAARSVYRHNGFNVLADYRICYFC